MNCRARGCLSFKIWSRNMCLRSSSLQLAQRWHAVLTRTRAGFIPSCALSHAPADLNDDDDTLHLTADAFLESAQADPAQARPALLASYLKAAKPQQLAAGLYLVATPIGNLEDITVRALRVLSAADTILAEDCRRTRILLGAYGIAGANLCSYHMHNEAQRSEQVVRLLQQGQVVALVSDAGTPGISDPGAVAVGAAIAAGCRVVPVPGPSAAVAAVTASGLPTLGYHFVGFLPSKTAARKKQLEALRENIQATMVFYVPPHGLLDCLKDMAEVLGRQRRCCVTRELTKVHETFHRATLADALAHFSQAGVRGEITLCVAGSSDEDMLAMERPQATPEDRLRELLDNGVLVSAAAKEVAQEFGIRKKDAYALALQLDGSTHKPRP